MGRKKYTGTANEMLNDDFAKATVVRLLRSNGASGYVMPICLSVLMLRLTHCPNSGMHLFLDNFHSQQLLHVVLRRVRWFVYLFPHFFFT